MSLEDLHKRYLQIAKESLSFLKEKGFQKKGMKYLKQNGELAIEIGSAVPYPTVNREERYRFEINFQVFTTNTDYIDVYMLIENEKNLKKAPLIYDIIIPDNYQGNIPIPYITSKDPEGWDEHYIIGFKESLEKFLVPWFENISSLEDLIRIAEEEIQLERNERKFFTANIRRSLLILYASQGMKEKTLAIADEYVAGVPESSRELAEKNKKKIIKYLEEREKLH